MCFGTTEFLITMASLVLLCLQAGSAGLSTFSHAEAEDIIKRRLFSKEGGGGRGTSAYDYPMMGQRPTQRQWAWLGLLCICVQQKNEMHNN